MVDNGSFANKSRFPYLTSNKKIIFGKFRLILSLKIWLWSLTMPNILAILHQIVLQNINNSFKYVHWNVKVFLGMLKHYNLTFPFLLIQIKCELILYFQQHTQLHGSRVKPPCFLENTQWKPTMVLKWSQNQMAMLWIFHHSNHLILAIIHACCILPLNLLLT